MSYLSQADFDAIMDTVSIFSISSSEIGDVSQYPFFVVLPRIEQELSEEDKYMCFCKP